MKLAPAPKRFFEDGHRSVDPETTLKRIEPLSKVAGVTRIAEITDLDRIGIPVFSSIRPSAESGAVSIYNGKGRSKTEAKVSAIMEAIERFSAEIRGDKIVRELTERMLEKGNALDPNELILPKIPGYHLAHQPIGWVKAIELNANEEIWIPANAVFHPYNPRQDMQLFRSNTNGLASGNDHEEAVLHGLCEIIERDSWSLCEGRRKVVADVVVPEKGAVRELVDKFTSQGISVHLKDLTSDIGITTVAAAADDTMLQDPSLLTLGIGSHLDPEVAALRALLEVAQSRLTQIHGAREDTVKADTSRKLGYERMKRINAMWFEPSGKDIALTDLPKLDTMDTYEDIRVVMAKLNALGLNKTIVADLTRKEIGMPVVRVIVPGLEVFAIDEDRIGPRLMEHFR